MTSLLDVRDLSVELGGANVLSGAGFEARAGELVGLIGPNGAGKTTLLRALSRLAPVRSGDALWEGRSLLRLDSRTRARILAYLPQGQAIHWPLTVRRLVELGRLPRLGALSKVGPADAEAVERALIAADVAGLADRVTSTLSGGEKARVLLARALAVEAPLLLADEPTASLDPHHVLEVMGVLRRTADQGGLVVVVLHDLWAAARFCDRLVLLDGGRKVAEGPPSEVLTAARVRQVYRIDAEAAGAADWLGLQAAG